MATGIEWCDETWNPLRARDTASGAEGWACVRVSPGCKNCYAATLNETQRWGWGTGRDYTVGALEKVEHYLDEETLTQPLRWKKPRRIFVCSMTDIFGEWVTDEWLLRMFKVMRDTPQHTYQVLTKRPERARDFMSRLAWRTKYPHEYDEGLRGFMPYLGEPGSAPLPNVWLGVSVEDQERADERIPLLLDTPAAVRFLSCEPLLGPVEFSDVTRRSDALQQLGRRALAGIDWVIVGGESGPGARPFDLAWARSLVQQCRAAGVAPFVKQLGSHVLDRNDAGFDGDDEDDWPEEMRTSGWYDSMYQGENVRVHLRHTHGGDPAEWPEDLRVREWPAAAEAVAR